MFQSFENRSEGHRSAERLEALRDVMASEGIDALVVPHADEHQSEYPAPSAERLAWLSGFTGSAGFAVVTRDNAFLFSDGRYTLQMREQTDDDAWTLRTLPVDTLEKLLEELGRVTLGVDPWLHTIAEARRLTLAVERAGGTLLRLAQNPIDRIWSDRPARAAGPITIHRLEHAGRTAKDKLADVAKAMAGKGADLHVVTDPLSLAWLFNLRGSDSAHNPIFFGWAIVHANRRPIVFVDEARLALSSRAYLTQLGDIVPESQFARHLAEASEGRAVWLDPVRAPDAVRGIVEWAGGSVVEEQDPVLLPRAIKNDVEIEGARKAHRQDGAAMVAFLIWLEGREVGTVTEIEATQRLERIRFETGERLGMPLREIAFDTIAGSGPHGAMVHYRVTSDTDRALGDGELFLLDSGGQYSEGTTDITRTLAIGKPTDEMRRLFTLVLKGMIAISRLRFPDGVAGSHIDAIARQALWAQGLDYAHGTGHGVGSYLAVHEGPHGISRRAKEPLKPGMIVSNEPGFYAEGRFGIRIENLVLVTEPELVDGAEIETMAFETLTLCPIDRALVEPSLLEPAELDWLDRYHARVFREIEPLLANDIERAWLDRACAPIAHASGEMSKRDDEAGSKDDDRNKAEA